MLRSHLGIVPLLVAVALSTGALTPGAPAQEPTPDKAAKEAAAGAALDVRLRPKSRVARAGAKVELVLRIEAKADAKVDGTVLAGTSLDTTVDGKPGPELRDRVVKTQLELGPKTVIERTLEVELERVAPNVDLKDGKLVPITFTWPGLPGAVATVDVAPDASKIALDALDLEKTRVLLLTSMGSMTVKFFPDKAPGHVKNFVKLAQEGFYDGTKFHRVIKNFMIQGGCPNTKEGAPGEPGTGDPGYRIPAEFNDVKHVRGILSMARSQDPNSAGCQFFVMHGEAPGLNGQYTAFGQLESGLETLDKIADVPVKQSRTGEASVPAEPVHLYAAILLPVQKR